MAEYVSVEEIYWSVQGDRIDPEKLPARALDEPPSTATTLAVIADYNQTPEQELTPQLDARFGQLAAIRIRAHPIRYYVVLPCCALPTCGCDRAPRSFPPTSAGGVQ